MSGDRLYIAAQLMAGMLSNPAGPLQQNGMTGWPWCNRTDGYVVDMALELAAKLIERNQRLTPPTVAHAETCPLTDIHGALAADERSAT